MRNNRTKQLVEEIGIIAMNVRKEYYGPIPATAIIQRMSD